MYNPSSLNNKNNSGKSVSHIIWFCTIECLKFYRTSIPLPISLERKDIEKSCIYKLKIVKLYIDKQLTKQEHIVLFVVRPFNKMKTLQLYDVYAISANNNCCYP